MFFIGHPDDDGSNPTPEALKVLTEKLAEIVKLIGGTLHK